MVAPRLLTTPSKALLILATLVFVTHVLPEMVTHGLDAQNLSWAAALLGLSSLVLVSRALLRPRQPQTIDFADDHVTLPKSAHSRRRHTVAYADINAIFRMEQRNEEVVLIDTKRRLISYNQSSFLQPEALASLWSEILSNVRALPDGRARLERMRALANTAYLTGFNRTRITRGLLALIALVFLVQVYSAALLNPFRMIDLGANSATLVAEGQWFRLVSANFLHGNWPHVIVNGVALFFLGTVLERLLGSRRLLFIFLVSALGGALASMLAAQGALSVGASTALFGLLGALGVVHLKFHRQLPVPYRQSVRWWVIILGLNTLLPLLIAMIDVAAHAGGFLAGALATWALLVGVSEFDPSRAPPRWLRLANAIVVAAFAIGIAQTVVYAINDHPGDDVRVLEDYLARAQTDGADALYLIAWSNAHDDRIERPRLELALRAGQQAQALEPQRADIAQVIARLQFRLAQMSENSPPD